MNNNTKTNFGWVKFYSEFADKLLTYKQNRTKLLTILESVHKQAGLRYPFTDKGQPLNDICPFTVFGAFNKGITSGNRIALMKAIGDRIGVQASVPVEFDGIPVLNNMQAWFFAYQADREPNDIDNLWNMFESGIKYADHTTENTRNDFVKWYDTVTTQICVKWNITMGFYWMRPYFYLNLDGKNRQFLLESDDAKFLNIKNLSTLKQLPDAETYLKIIELCKNGFSSEKAAFHSFPELSQAAWITSVPERQDKGISKASFLQWFEPLVDALKDLGGSATPEAARNQIIINLNLSDDIVNETRGKTGVKKFDNEVAWARNYLAYEGIIDKSIRGTWVITEEGKGIIMTRELASEIFLKWADILKKRREASQENENAERLPKEKHFWIYAPGEGSRKWDEFRTQSIMGIGWDNLGDLTQYPDREAMRKKRKKFYMKLIRTMTF